MTAAAYDVVILGYSGEPYLRVGAAGAFENVRSPAVYLNATRNGGIPPSSADPSAPPEWRRIGVRGGPRSSWRGS